MDAHDFRSCTFCARDKGKVVTVPHEHPANVIACPECGATRPKRLPGVTLEVAVDAGNRRFGFQAGH